MGRQVLRLNDVRADIVMLGPRTGRQLLPAAHTLGLHRVAFGGDDIDATIAGLLHRGGQLIGEVVRFEDSYRLCCVRGPEGIIVMLAEELGRGAHACAGHLAGRTMPPGPTAMEHTHRHQTGSPQVWPRALTRRRADVGAQVSAGRRGTRFRDPSAPPPVNAELTRLSLRWTHRALLSVVAVWTTAGAVGAYFDLVTRYPSLTWSVTFGGYGTGATWKVQVARGDLTVFALLIMGMAVVPALIGARRMSIAARSGRPHQGPSLWLLWGVAIAMGLGSNIIGSFVLSDVMGPSHGATLVAGFAPQVLGLYVGGVFVAVVRDRFNPWRWGNRADRRTARAVLRRSPRAPIDWKRTAEESLRGERPPINRARASRAARANSRRVAVTSAGMSWRTVVGRRRFIPAAHIGRIRLTEVEVASGGHRQVYAYALVHDVTGAVLLRIATTSGGAKSSAERRLRELCAPLDVPVARHPSVFGRAKDLRRRWPEAFSRVRAYPLVATVVGISLWITVAVPVLDLLTG